MSLSNPLYLFIVSKAVNNEKCNYADTTSNSEQIPANKVKMVNIFLTYLTLPNLTSKIDHLDHGISFDNDRVP